MEESAALTAVLDLERELQRSGARESETRLRELLAPDFIEVGASGREWDLESILGLLRDETSTEDAAPIEVLDLRGRVIAPGVVQVSWALRGDRRARRTSLWCKREPGWQQAHHQATPLP